MAVMLTKWERREDADRDAFGNAAFVLCREQRARPGVTGCRFFWTSPDEVAVLAEAESAQVFDEPPQPELTRALFGLADILPARQRRSGGSTRATASRHTAPRAANTQQLLTSRAHIFPNAPVAAHLRRQGAGAPP
jgi:hypothetical protein